MRIASKFRLTDAAIFISLLVALYWVFSLKLWNDPNRVITWDVTNYYSYLPATFIYGDPTLEFTRENPEKWYAMFVPLTSPTGGKIIKMSMGLSCVYAPFFGLAHLSAPILGYEADGYSVPYRFALIFSSLIFFLIGLIFLKKLLLNYYTDKVAAVTVLLIGIGTNLLYYTAIRSPMTHSYNFALLTIFLWGTIKWYKKQSIGNSILLGLLAGLITLIRPTNALILILFLFYDIKNLKDIQSRVNLFFNRYYFILIMVILAYVIWIPQMIYWKEVAGKYLYFSYQDEHFYFNNPQIWRGLFSYRNGWLVYTPVMLFAISGFVLLYKQYRQFFWPLLIFLVLNIYVILSWWCWWYVGYGNRAFIDIYGIMAIPLAALVQRIFNMKIKWKVTFLTVALFILYLNLFQTWQYYKGYIQFDSMTKAAYWNIFLKSDPKDRFWGLISSPDYEKAVKGIYEDLPNE